MGGPSAAAIRNKTGDDYKGLIKIYAEAVGGKAKKVTARKGSILDEILEGVSDPVRRTRIGVLLAELESIGLERAAPGRVSALLLLQLYAGATSGKLNPAKVIQEIASLEGIKCK